MPKVKVNEEVVGQLQQEISQLSRENIDVVLENELVRRQNTMLIEALESVVSDQSYWSEESIRSGIVWRLSNVLEQIKQMR